MTEKEFNAALANKIKEARKSKGYQQGDLLPLLGFTRTQLTNIENGKSGTTIYKIALLLKVLEIELPVILDSDILETKQRIELTAKNRKDKKIARLDKRIKQLEQTKSEIEKI